MEPTAPFLEEVVAFILVVFVGILALELLLGLYRAVPAQRPARKPRAWTQHWEFPASSSGRFSYFQLILASLLGLFLEVLMIRWISSEIRVFAYFKNFALIACFLGFGLGCYLCRRKVNLLALVVPLLVLVVLVKLPWLGLRALIWRLPLYLGATSEVHLWGVPSLPLDATSWLTLVTAIAVILPLFALISFAFIPLGQLVGWQLENAPNGIAAYSVNVLASLAGIGLYTLLCFFSQPPTIWFSLAGVILITLLWKVPRLRWGSAVVFAVLVAMLSLGTAGASVHWSPYQKLTLFPRSEGGRIIAYELNTNDSWYQRIIDLSPGFVAANPQLFQDTPVETNAYNLPYRFYSAPPSVLVLGSGMGNDVAAALRNGAGRVVAVEIDPLILNLGRKLHFEKPYDSPRVRQVVDDARSYIQNTGERFDMIVFSLLDSHTTSSHFSNIRIDNYVYTFQALRATQGLLNPDGIFVVKFQVNTPWIAGRLHGLLSAVFGRPPLQLQAEESGYTTPGRFFISGYEPRIRQALRDPSLLDYVRKRGNFRMELAPATTDDWPYFYQREPGLPLCVIVASCALLILCSWMLRQTGCSAGSVRWHFFFLGAGFLLLEAQIISKAALLFGTTWVVNSIVIAGLLLFILAANALAAWAPNVSIRWAYGGILGSILLAYLVPLERFFLASRWSKALAATAVLSLPVFFAGVVFIRSFAQAGFSSEALGSNLFGALVGGLLESLSFWTGLKSLLVIAALLYLASYWALAKKSASLVHAETEFGSLPQ